MTLSPTIRALTERYVEAGCTVPELANLFGIPPRHMRSRLESFGLKARLLTADERKGRRPRKPKEPKKAKPPKPPSERSQAFEQRNQVICQKYLEGNSLQTVGDGFGITRERVRQILVKNGVEERFVCFKESRACKKEGFQKVIQLYLKGWTLTEAHRQLGMPAYTLQKYRSRLHPAQHKVHRVARFWRQVDVNGPFCEKLGSKCWVWTGCFNAVTGYGSWSWSRNGKHINISTHRFVYSLTKGKPTQWVLHGCDNPICVNPDHLYDGTAKENARDRDRLHGYKKRLSFTQCEEVRRLWALGVPLESLKKQFDRSGSTINHIVQDEAHGRKRQMREEAVRRVWELKGHKTIGQVCEITGVGRSSVSSIWNGWTGNHITGLPTRQKNLTKKSPVG